ncbi:MAG: response regulator [Alphaproteobacteria bacterium]|nr:MAG: response regulator [Alphaproteobacteria bacterium]
MSTLKPDYAAMTALVAFSNPQLLRIIYHFLGDLGVGDIHCAKGSLEALRLAEGNSYDLCFVDHDLEDMGGPDLTRFLRTTVNATAQALIFTVVTAPDRDRVVAARDAGAHEILGLPLTTGLLHNRLHHALMNPKPFVQTPSFTGPCRRRDQLVLFRGDDRRLSEPGTRRVMAVNY